MDGQGVGLLAAIALLAIAALVVVTAAAAILYATDSKVGATVVETECGTRPLADASRVTVVTKFPLPGIEHRMVDVDNAACISLVEGQSYAEYFLRSGRVVLYEREGGSCMHDTAARRGCGE
jgi:hypothetical protein